MDGRNVDRAELRIGGTVIRARPPGETKAHISLRIDKGVLGRFHEDGPRWQSWMNEALRKAAGL